MSTGSESNWQKRLRLSLVSFPTQESPHEHSAHQVAQVHGDTVFLPAKTGVGCERSVHKGSHR